MSATSKKATPIIGITAQGSQEAQVLYQKLGNRWYAFSLVNDEVFVGAVSGSAEIDHAAIQDDSANTRTSPSRGSRHS